MARVRLTAAATLAAPVDVPVDVTRDVKRDTGTLLKRAAVPSTNLGR